MKQNKNQTESILEICNEHTHTVVRIRSLTQRNAMDELYAYAFTFK